MKTKAGKLKVPLDLRESAKDLRVFNDFVSGKRKRLPLTWSVTNYVVVPSPIWIRAVRRRFGLTTHDFGSLVGLQAADIKSWEKGTEVPNASASRLMGLLAQKPHLVKFMGQAWPDDPDAKTLGPRAWRSRTRFSQ
jgi:DNA-binding transcriptional regulator YiaG